LDEGDAAGQKAARPYFDRAGAGLINLACADETQSESDFWAEAIETFGRPKKILRAYMESAFDSKDLNSQSQAFETLGELLRAKGKQTKSGSRTLAKNNPTCLHLERRSFPANVVPAPIAALGRSN
jgi:hypothetical protein